MPAELSRLDRLTLERFARQLERSNRDAASIPTMPPFSVDAEEAMQLAMFWRRVAEWVEDMNAPKLAG